MVDDGWWWVRMILFNILEIIYCIPYVRNDPTIHVFRESRQVTRFWDPVPSTSGLLHQCRNCALPFAATRLGGGLTLEGCPTFLSKTIFTWFSMTFYDIDSKRMMKLFSMINIVLKLNNDIILYLIIIDYIWLYLYI